MNRRKVIVIGAGIGGLAVARALVMHGADVTVLEQADAIREVGAGIQITPNGMAVLRGLGVSQALRDTGAIAAQAISLRNAPGREVVRLDLARHAPGAEYLFVHRADLIEVLAGAARAAGVKIRPMHRVRALHRRDDGALDVETCTGARLRGELVIGADGLHSVVRPILNRNSRAFFTRQVAWRAVVPETGDPAPEVRLFMGPHRHLVTYPLRSGRERNIVAVEETPVWTDEGWSAVGDPGQMRAAFAGFGPEVAALLGRVDTVHRWGLFRHPVARQWAGPGLALLGDAAHPTLPFMAQGANMALEDAWVMAAKLAAADDIDTGLRAYESARKMRATRVVNAASRNAWKYHLAFPPLRAAGHLVLGLGGRVAPGAMVRQFDWIYRHDVTAD